MKFKIFIVLLTLCSLFLVAGVSAKESQPQAVPLTVEQQQQFSYYWYGAKQAIEQERYTDALALLEFCRMIKPDDGQTLTFLGILYDGIGLDYQALQLFQQAFEADPRDQWYKYMQALIEIRTPESIQEAQRVLEKALEVQKDKPDEDLLEHLRRLYLSTGQYTKAIVMQDRMDALKGYDVYSALNRYRTYLLARRPKKALEAVDKFLELEPTNLQFLLFRAELIERTRVKQEELYALYERILNLDPKNLMVLNNYAYHLATHNGDLKKAERMSSITIQEEPQNPVYLDTYGWILHLQGQDELALFFLNRALNTVDEASRKEIMNHLLQVKKEKK